MAKHNLQDLPGTIRVNKILVTDLIKLFRMFTTETETVPLEDRDTWSQENSSNTPDFILSQYLLACLLAFNVATQQRENWYRRDPRPTTPTKVESGGK